MAKLSKGFKEFLIKSGVFVMLFIAIQLIMMGIVAKTTLPGELKLYAMDDLAEAVLFMLVIFIGLNRNKILKIKSYTVGIWTRFVSLAVIIVGFIGYFHYKQFLLENLGLTASHIYLFTAIEYLILFTILFFLLVLVFGFNFCRDFFKENKLGLVLVLIGTAFVYHLIQLFQSLWKPVSIFVGDSVVYILNLFGTANFYYVNELPIIKLNDFAVGIAKTCSGIDSVLLFTGLYLGILAWDWKLLNKKKVISMFFVGVLGAFALNIIRIVLLILIGVYISKDFALQTFHTNASSLLFIIYFAVFWKLMYKWMRK
ncbi:MAG: archaeosortase/exosortase family protein [Nanoarchaeota archaeon]|nr:archaeosortase/exosortase family protein [Nanoarchaeota archaeon]